MKELIRKFKAHIYSLYDSVLLLDIKEATSIKRKHI